MEKKIKKFFTEEELGVIRISLEIRLNGIRGGYSSEEDVIRELLKKLK